MSGIEGNQSGKKDIIVAKLMLKTGEQMDSNSI